MAATLQYQARHQLVKFHHVTGHRVIWCCSCGADGAVAYRREANARYDHNTHVEASYSEQARVAHQAKVTGTPAGHFRCERCWTPYAVVERVLLGGREYDEVCGDCAAYLQGEPADPDSMPGGPDYD